MTDNVTTAPAPEETQVAAPGPETTAAPAPEPSPEGSTEPAPEKTYTQAELDAIIGKRLARERRSLERELATRQPSPQPEAPQGELSREQFDSDEAFIDAKADQKAAIRIAQRDAEAAQRAAMTAHDAREEKARERFEDYDTVVKNPSLAISPAMASLIVQSDMGPDVIYHLGQHPDEALRIYNLPPFLQAKELGKIEVKVASEPPTRKTSSAPAPITPIRTPASKPVAYDTTDPRACESLTMAEWKIAEDKREAAVREAQFH